MLNEQLINPKSIVIIGGSNDINKPGGKIVKNIIDGGYQGILNIVNPKYNNIQGILGFSLHKELEELVNVGLSPFEALKISTTNTYEFLGELEESGTIEIGKKANLLLLDKNPLDDISNTRSIYGVMTQDQWIPKNEIDDRLLEIKESFSKLKERN